MPDETQKYLEERWTDLASGYCNDQKTVRVLWDEIKDRYTNKGRHYHNLEHIRYMLESLDEYTGEIDDPDIVRFAIFYHDLIYNAHRSDNEKRSAERAGQRLQMLGLSEDRIQRCIRHILATNGHAATDDPDSNLLLDIDLAVLGESRERFIEFGRKIRKEFGFYPEMIYRRAKRKILRKFKDKTPLYNTPEYRAQFEEQAKSNLDIELK